MMLYEVSQGKYSGKAVLLTQLLARSWADEALAVQCH